MKKTLFKNKKRGFTLLFASLVVSLILSIGLAIAHITLIQLQLSSAGRESQFAFYNADAGLECALYHEYNNARSDGSAFFSGTDDSIPSDFECGGQTATYVTATQTGATTTTTFKINPSISGCNKDAPSYTVQVQRSTVGYLSKVRIESRGYNTCDPTNPRRVERGIFVVTQD